MRLRILYRPGRNGAINHSQPCFNPSRPPGAKYPPNNSSSGASNLNNNSRVLGVSLSSKIHFNSSLSANSSLNKIFFHQHHNKLNNPCSNSNPKPPNFNHKYNNPLSNSNSPNNSSSRLNNQFFNSNLKQPSNLFSPKPLSNLKFFNKPLAFSKLKHNSNHNLLLSNSHISLPHKLTRCISSPPLVSTSQNSTINPMSTPRNKSIKSSDN